MNFLQEIWNGVKPNLVRSTTTFLNEFVKYFYDFAISCSIWGFFYLFKLLTIWLPAGGWVAGVIVFLHDLGVVAAMGNLLFSIVIDIVQSLQSRRGGLVCFA
jgi:putative effector of murein hydrolase LrgA (UPF0299 family)